MTTIKGQKASLYLDGEFMGNVNDFHFTPTPKRYVKTIPARREAFDVSMEMHVKKGDMDRFIEMLMPPKPKGAWNETLAKRVRYGGRKGIRAARRLNAKGLMAVHIVMGDTIESCAVEKTALSIRVPITFDDYIAKHAIDYCTRSFCPKCGWSSPCCNHVEVDIGVGTQTGNHEYVCRLHGTFVFPNDGGEPIFPNDAS